jgi:hypothetical protein
MDNNFLETWGNMFMTAAKGQKQIDDFSKMMKEGIDAFQGKNALLCALPGLDALSQITSEYLKIFTEFSGEIQNSLKDYLALLDLVPKKEYQELLKENEALKKSIEEKKRSKVGKMLDEELSLQTEGLKSFEKLIKNQTEQFADLMTGFTTFFSQPQDSTATESPKKRETKKGHRVKRKPAGTMGATKK